MSGPALVILAAGESVRLGTCKALVDLGGASPLERLFVHGSVLEAAPVLIVTGAHHQAIATMAPEGCELLHNPDWARGRTGSVLMAHRARPGLDVCLAPIDVPLVDWKLFEALQRAWEAGGSPGRGWLSPWVEVGQRRRHGHPVVIGRDLLEDLSECPPDMPLRNLRDRAVLRMSIPHVGREILDDLDTRQDLEVLRQRLAGQET